jgi:hypothetical protein
MLGGYGGIRTKGKDVLGRESQIIYRQRVASAGSNWLADATWHAPGGPEIGPMQGGPPDPGPGPGPGFQTTDLAIWPWTRSEISGNTSDRGGSPFAPAAVGDSNDQLDYGNPNGIRDALILVLTAGEDYKGNS